MSNGGGIPLDYQVLREPVQSGANLCPQCHAAQISCQVTVNRIERNGRLVREWQRWYCEQCGQSAYDQARAECHRKLYGWQGHSGRGAA